MADVDVAQWLEQWVEENLTARRHVDRKAEIHDQAQACAAEARSAGIALAEIEEAADGDLDVYLQRRQNAETERTTRPTGFPAAAAPMRIDDAGAGEASGGLRAALVGAPSEEAVIATDAAFLDRTLELQEFAEELVLSKEVRIVAEITLRRASRGRVETVRDTVRRTAVEVEDGRAARSGDGGRVAPRDVTAPVRTALGAVDHVHGPGGIEADAPTSAGPFP